MKLTDEEREFIGFFWGEGYFGIRKSISWTSKDKNFQYNPVLKITQRSDNPDILNWCKNRFGGSMHYRDKTYVSLKRSNYKANPRYTWEVQGFKRVREVVNILLQGKLPDKKRDSLKIFNEFLYSGVGVGRKTTQKILDKQAELKLALINFKKYKPSVVK